jgi:hypothetical protein
MPIPLLIPLILSVAGSIAKSRAEGTAAQEDTDYLRNTERYTKREKERQERADRLSNVLKIMGYDTQVPKKEFGDKPAAPKVRGPGMGDSLSTAGSLLGNIWGMQQMQGAPGDAAGSSRTNPLASGGIGKPGLWNSPTGMTGRPNPYAPTPGKNPWESWMGEVG